MEKDSRFKFVDDLTALEAINLLIVGLASHNPKIQVPNNIHMSNQFIPAEHIKSQDHINKIQEWTVKQKMVLNEEKTKTMTFNFTKKKQFSTELKLNGKVIETVKDMKLLGTIITSDLKWSKNTKYLVKRAYSRMELLRQMTNFTKSTKDKLHIYKMYIRSVLEQSCVVWGSSITKKSENKLERVQKVAVKLISNNYITYLETLTTLNLETLKERRMLLIQRFAERSYKNNKTRSMFQLNESSHTMDLRKQEKFKVINAKTVRMQRSAIPTMTRHLNNKHEEKRKLLNNLTQYH